MSNLDQKKIKDFYNNVEDVWWLGDPWHNHSKQVIANYIAKQRFFRDSSVLNAGSAGNTYDIDCRVMHHVDIADEKIKHLDNAIVSSIEKMPYEDNFFDNILCVGSVLNYCDAIAAISELARVLKPKGNLILEFESSWGFEYLGKKQYKDNASIITTEYIEKEHIQWLYAPNYIYRIIQSCGFTIVETKSFHIIDGLLSKFMKDRYAVKITKLDYILGKCPLFKKHGNNIILHCVKMN